MRLKNTISEIYVHHFGSKVQLRYKLSCFLNTCKKKMIYLLKINMDCVSQICHGLVIIEFHPAVYRFGLFGLMSEA